MTYPHIISVRKDSADGLRSLVLHGTYTGEWLAWNHHLIIADMMPKRRTAWQKRRARRMARQHRLHIDAAYDLWQARQYASTAVLARRTLRCFAGARAEQDWIDQALPLVPLLREAHLHRAAFELWQWIVCADQLFKSCGCADNSGFCLLCPDDATRSHALLQQTCHHWQRRQAELLCAAWDRHYNFTDLLLEMQSESNRDWQMLSALEECDPEVFQAALMALAGYRDALLLPPQLQQYALAAIEALVQVAARVSNIGVSQGCDRIYFGTQHDLVNLFLSRARAAFLIAEPNDTESAGERSDRVDAQIWSGYTSAVDGLSGSGGAGGGIRV